MSNSAKRKPLMSNPAGQRIIIPLVVAAILLAAWQSILVVMKVPPYLVPTPWATLTALVQDWNVLGPALMFTLKITALSFILSVLIGVLVAFVFVQNRVVELAFFPYVVLLQVTPVVAIAPLIIIWVSNITLAMVICSVLMSIFPIISNTALGLRSVPSGLLAYFKLRQASRLQVLLRLRVPAALPYFFAALRISSGLALIGAVVGEFVAGTGGNDTGLAYQILQAGFQLNIPRMFAALVLISIAGIALFAIMSILSQRAIGYWHDSNA